MRDTPLETQVEKTINVSFIYVYPDEDGDSVEATLDLETGNLTLSTEIPEDVTDPSVRTRIELSEPWEAFPVTCLPESISPGWRVAPEDLEHILKNVNRQLAEPTNTSPRPAP